MCELFGLSSSRLVSSRELLCRFGARGDDVADNPVGWGLAALQDAVFSITKEPHAAAQSAHFQGLCEQTLSALIVGHVRKVNHSTARVLANTHPFRRTCCRRDWVFAHNGVIPDAVTITPPSAANLKMFKMPDRAKTVCLWTALASASLGSAVTIDDLSASSSIGKHHGESPFDNIVPVSVENGQVIVDVTINGQGPFPMMFDTGGVEAVTPETAASLGLGAEGGGTVQGSGESKVPVAATHLKALRLGGAELLEITVPVIPLPRFFTDRGSRPPLAGLVGYELLKQFAARLSYEDRTLTMIPARDFHYGGPGERAPLFFVGKIPVMSAAADGIVGRFEIDTGSSSALVLQRPFVEQHGFEVRHPGGLHMKTGGLDGVFETVATRLDHLRIANAEIKRPVAEFPSDGKGGLPVADVDGSIGYQILRQFVITFDYSRRELWFERSAAFGMKTVQWKTGFQAVKAEGPKFRVVTVLPNTPAAAAGISVGDVITEVDGRPAGSIGQAEFSGLMRGSDGTVVRLGIVRDGTRHSVALTLKELLP